MRSAAALSTIPDLAATAASRAAASERRQRRQRLRPPAMPRPQLYIFGEIEGAVPCWPLTRLYCSWRLVFDSKMWWVIQGETEGETYLSDASGHGFCVWNHPVSLHLAGRSLQGWPRLELVVRGSDSHGRRQLAGYGSWAIPCAPGTSEVLCRCWRPAGQGLLGRLRAHLLGIVPELLHTEIVADPGKSRAGLSTEDSVDVLLRLSVVHQNFKENGLEVASSLEA